MNKLIIAGALVALVPILSVHAQTAVASSTATGPNSASAVRREQVRQDLAQSGEAEHAARVTGKYVGHDDLYHGNGR